VHWEEKSEELYKKEWRREKKEMKGAVSEWWNTFLFHSLSVSWSGNILLLFAISKCACNVMPSACSEVRRWLKNPDLNLFWKFQMSASVYAHHFAVKKIFGLK